MIRESAMNATAESCLSRAAVEEVSIRQEEPEWLRKSRRDAWEMFEVTPWPDASQEEWRRVDRSGLNLEKYRALATAPGHGGRPGEALSLWALADGGGEVKQIDWDNTGSALAPELARRGVIFTSLAEAARRYPERVEAHLGRAAAPESGKLEALNAALWSGGAFLYVPRGVEVEMPLTVRVTVDAPGLAVFPRLLVIVDEGASVTLYEEHGSKAPEGEAFVSPLAEVFVGDGAHVRYTTIQRWGMNVREFGTRCVRVGRHARLDWMTTVFGARQSKMRLQGIFAGEGSESRLRGLYLPGGSQEFHLDTLQDHQAAHTVSDLYFKGALRDAARAVYYGIIRVHPEAQHTNGYQQNRNLLLSDGTKADSIPILEIEANEVRCSHGATIGQLDADHLFYLMCRGLPRAEAARMLVEAFFREILDTIPGEAVREQVARAIAEKVNKAW